MENDSRIRKYFRRIGMLAVLLLVLLPAQTRAEDVEKTVFHYLIDEMEFSPAAACGVMGNIKAESGFIPSIVGLGNAYGLCQWTGARTARLRSFCSSKKLDSASAEGQMAFLEYELQNYYPQVYYYLMSVTNDANGAYNAGYYWCMHFEIPANRYAASVYRGNLAKNTYWPQYGQNSFLLTADLEDGGVKLSWRNCSTKKIAVMRSTKKNGTYKEIARVKTTEDSYVDKTTVKQKKYYYYTCPVRGGEAKPEERSNRVSVTTSRMLNDPECSITLSRTEYTYNGKEKKPEVTVTYQGSKLKEKRDYTVTYKKNINAGRAAVLVTGAGSYKGSIKKKFTINKAVPVIQAENLRTVWTNRKVPAKVTVKKVRNPVYKLKTEDKSVAKGSGSKLVLRGSGVTRVRVLVPESDNFLAGEASFRLTVKPDVPQIRKCVISGKELIVKWDCEGAPDGVEIRYTKEKKFSDSAEVLEAGAEAKGKARIALKKAKGQWKVRIRSFKVKANGKRIYSSWSSAVPAR